MFELSQVSSALCYPCHIDCCSTLEKVFFFHINHKSLNIVILRKINLKLIYFFNFKTYFLKWFQLLDEFVEIKILMWWLCKTQLSDWFCVIHTKNKSDKKYFKKIFKFELRRLFSVFLLMILNLSKIFVICQIMRYYWCVKSVVRM